MQDSTLVCRACAPSTRTVLVGNGLLSSVPEEGKEMEGQVAGGPGTGQGQGGGRQGLRARGGAGAGRGPGPGRAHRRAGLRTHTHMHRLGVPVGPRGHTQLSLGCRERQMGVTEHNQRALQGLQGSCLLGCLCHVHVYPCPGPFRKEELKTPVTQAPSQEVLRSSTGSVLLAAWSWAFLLL